MTLPTHPTLLQVITEYAGSIGLGFVTLRDFYRYNNDATHDGSALVPDTSLNSTIPYSGGGAITMLDMALTSSNPISLNDYNTISVTGGNLPAAANVEIDFLGGSFNGNGGIRIVTNCATVNVNSAIYSNTAFTNFNLIPGRGFGNFAPNGLISSEDIEIMITPTAITNSGGYIAGTFNTWTALSSTQSLKVGATGGSGPTNHQASINANVQIRIASTGPVLGNCFVFLYAINDNEG
jgi:hypothetical protein